MKGVIFNIEQDAINLVNEINATFNGLFVGVTTSYTYVLKHPSLNSWAVIVKMKQVNKMQVEHPDLLNSLSFGVNDIQELDSSWIYTDEFH